MGLLQLQLVNQPIFTVLVTREKTFRQPFCHQINETHNVLFYFIDVFGGQPCCTAQSLSSNMQSGTTNMAIRVDSAPVGSQTSFPFQEEQDTHSRWAQSGTACSFSPSANVNGVLSRSKSSATAA
eukprot:m.37777 g.37777  ORF g.37777 m.37777 type:complete len:125 (-) comp10131_c0_seq1:1847-2221(-)